MNRIHRIVDMKENLTFVRLFDGKSLYKSLPTILCTIGKVRTEDCRGCLGYWEFTNKVEKMYHCHAWEDFRVYVGKLENISQ